MFYPRIASRWDGNTLYVKQAPEAGGCAMGDRGKGEKGDTGDERATDMRSSQKWMRS